MSGDITPRILIVGTRLRWVVSFTPRPLYPWDNRPLYPLGRRLGGPQSRSRLGGEGKNSHYCLCLQLNPSLLAHSLVYVLTELSPFDTYIERFKTMRCTLHYGI